MRFFPAGDCAVTVLLGDEISVELNIRLRGLEFGIRRQGIPGVVETVAAFNTLLVYYDPLVIDYRSLCESIEAAGEQIDASKLPPSRRVEIPCCYDSGFGLDLEAAAGRLGLPIATLVGLHAGAEYYVYFLGFTPGLPYMGGTPPQIQLPRLETPRTRVPAGSVGLGGVQACIYSVESPGGYWILGRTPLCLYDPDAHDPVLLRPGDRVHLRPIDRGEFDSLAAAVSAGRYTPVIS